jgi:membrane protease YdiL (CAAX protease family)
MQRPFDMAMVGVLLAVLAGSIAVWSYIARRLLERRELVPFEPRTSVPWTGLDLIVLGVLVLGFESVAIWIANQGTGDEAKRLSEPVVAAIGISRLAWLLFAVGYFVRLRGAYADDMGFDFRYFKSDVRLGGLTFLAALLPVYGLQFALTKVFGFESENPLVKLVNDEQSPRVLIVATAAAVAVAPLVEEFLFRVALQGWLEKSLNRSRGYGEGWQDRPAGFGPIVVAGLIFGLLHLNSGIDWAALFVLSLFIGYAYQRTHRIVAPLTIHFCINTLAMLELWRQYVTAPS